MRLYYAQPREAGKEYLAFITPLDGVAMEDRITLFFVLKGREVCVRQGKNETVEVFCRVTKYLLEGRKLPDTLLDCNE